jgi:TolB-like protein
MPDHKDTGTAKGAIFLSYASQDTEVAKRICGALQAAGIDVWFDQSELRGGDAWDAKIRRQIRECTLFVPIISAATQGRAEGYFRLEWKLAVDRSHLLADDHPFLFPVIVGNISDAAARVPEKFKEVQWTRLRLDETPTELAARMARLLGAGQPATAIPLSTHRGGGAAPKTTTKGPPTWLWVVVVVVAGIVAYGLFRPRRSPEEIAKLLAIAQSVASTAEKAADDARPTLSPATAEPKPATAEPVPVPSTDEKSVAVLSFTNLSDEKENEYFSEGISEELLNVLQKIPGLRVAARTSAFSFKGSNATAQEIGQKLGVADLVEGTVQKSGTRVKVTVHLSRAASGEELWSMSYTRELKDVFALQEELALAIVGELRGQLDGGQSAIQVKAAVKGGTTNPEAYQLYLQGRYYQARFSEKNMGDALGYFQRAVRIDSNFALAWAGLARAHVWFCEFSTEQGQEGFKAHLVSAREALEHALAIEPNLPEALFARFELQLNVDFDWKGAEKTLREALALAPSDPELVTNAGTLAEAKGESALSTELYRRAVALDPVNPRARSLFAFNLVDTRHYAEAEAQYPQVVDLNPEAPWAHAGLGYCYVLEGKYDEAVAAAQEDSAEWCRLLVVAIARFSQKRIAESDAALAKLEREYGESGAYQVAEVHAYRGEKKEAFEWLERALRQHDGGLTDTRIDPLLDNLRTDPRFPEFIRKLGVSDEQLK